MANATVKGGLYASLTNTLIQVRGISPHRRTIARWFGKLKSLRELAETLNGTAVGGAALKTEKRLKHTTFLDQGGKRPIETVDIVNRVTAAADETAIDADILTYGGYDSTPPVNKDQNPLGTR